ncbi:MAG: hypothetical protein PHY79_04900 [Anaerolineae bacterium]|jgi:hypothetical protein|nr:hypothetical protein [Anaerolineae bacterium]
MPGLWAPFVALAAALLPLLWVKTWITHSLQELSLRWTGDPAVALVVYFVLVLPGVVIHELSHWLMATILGVRVSKLSLGPVRKGRNSVSLGSVRVGKVDPLRASLIGVAPLLGATAVILLIGRLVLGLDEVVALLLAGAWEGLGEALGEMVRVADFWLWLYLIFAISNAMLPSESDMSTVRPVLIFLGILAAVLILVNGIPSIPREAVQAVGGVAGYLASAFALTLAADGIFVLVIGLLLWLTRQAQGW